MIVSVKQSSWSVFLFVSAYISTVSECFVVPHTSKQCQQSAGGSCQFVKLHQEQQQQQQQQQLNLQTTLLSPSSSRRERSSIVSVSLFETKPNQEKEQQQQQQQQQTTLTPEQTDFIMGYLNKHHSDLLLKFATIFSPLGAEMAKANVWSGGSFELSNAKMVDVSQETFNVQVTVNRRGKPDTTTETVTISLDAHPIPEKLRAHPSSQPIRHINRRRFLVIDDVVRRFCRLCWIANQPEVSGKFIQLGIQLGGAGIGKLPENMYLNQVPHNRFVRQYFYDTAAQAVLDAVIILCAERVGTIGNTVMTNRITNRMKVIAQFPEMNPSMDSYRIGTLLEMVRTMAIRLAEQNLRVRVCVQGSMGVGIFTGVPKQLSGVAKLLQMMDWQSETGEENEGMVGTYVNFGAIGAEHVQNEIKDAEGNILQQQDDVFILIAPQSMVGTDSSIIPLLSAMVDAAGDRPVILLNPDLTDKVSAAGQQSVRGRQQRIDFANSFQTVYQFQNIYVSGTSYFPILGAMTKLHPTQPWVAHQRREFANKDGGEVYVPVLAAENMPPNESIMKAFDM